MANWWDSFNPMQNWGPTGDGEVQLNAGDQVLNVLTGGLYGTAKGTQQTGDLGRGLMGSYGQVANYATGNFGRDQQRAVTDAEAADVAEAERTRQTSILEQAKANKANAPYAAAGRDALAQQRALAGLDGPEAQAAAFAMIENSPQFQSMVDQSEQAILANASATGGLRGGNVQQSLAQNRPQILSDLINQQYNRFGGLAAAGQQGGQFTSGLGLQYAGMQGDIGQQIGSARAGGILGRQAAENAARQQAVQFGTQAAGLVASGLTGMPIGGGFGGVPQVPTQQNNQGR
jgi:hypothetical protein